MARRHARWRARSCAQEYTKTPSMGDLEYRHPARIQIDRLARPLRGGVLAIALLAGMPGAARAAEAPLATRHLLEAVLRNDIASVRAAVADGADLAGKNARGATAAEIAVDLGHVEIANYLLALTQLRKGETPPTLPANLPSVAVEKADSEVTGTDAAGERETPRVKAPARFPLPPEKPTALASPAPETTAPPAALAAMATAAAPAAPNAEPAAKPAGIDAPYDPSRFLQGLTSKPAKKEEAAPDNQVAALPVTPLPARDAEALVSRAMTPSPQAKQDEPPSAPASPAAPPQADIQAAPPPKETSEAPKESAAPTPMAMPSPETSPAVAETTTAAPEIEIPAPLPTEPKPSAEISSSVPPLLPPPAPPARDDNLADPAPVAAPTTPEPAAAPEAPSATAVDRIVDALAGRMKAGEPSAASTTPDRPPEPPTGDSPAARLIDRMQQTVSGEKTAPPAKDIEKPAPTAGRPRENETADKNAAVEPPPTERPDWTATPAPAAAEPTKPSATEPAKPVPGKQAVAEASDAGTTPRESSGFFGRLFGTITELNPFAARREAAPPKPVAEAKPTPEAKPAPARDTGPTLPPPTALLERQQTEKREQAAERPPPKQPESRAAPQTPKPAESNPAEPKAAAAAPKDDDRIRDPRALGDENAYRSKNMFQRLAEWLEGKDDSKPRFKPLPAELLQAERAAARATQRALRDDQAAQTAKDKDPASWSPTVEKAGAPRTEPQLAEATPGTAKPPGATWAPTVEKNAPGTGTPSPAGSLFGLGGSAAPPPTIDGPAADEPASTAAPANAPSLFGMGAKPPADGQQQAALPPPADSGGLFGVGGGTTPAKDAKPAQAAPGQPWNVTSVEQADKKPPLVRADPALPQALPVGAGFAFGNALTLGKIPPDTRAEAEKGRSCIEKQGVGVAFCIEPPLWPKAMEPTFVVSTILYTGPMAIVRYDGGIATRMQALFPTEEFEKVVAYFNQRYGQPSEYWTRSIAPLAAARRDNPTQTWRARHPKTGEVMTLEVRKYDDTRGGFPDTKRGVVMLYIHNAKPIFPQVSSLELMRLRRQR